MNRVLFVESDLAALREIDRAMGPRRRVWEAATVAHGADGLFECAREPFDLVVTNATLPDMSGIEFLRAVSVQWPGTIRVLAADPSADNTAVRAAAVAHQVLSKPFTPGILPSLLDESVELAGLMANPTIASIVGDPSGLPSIPATYLRLTELLADDEVTIADLTGVIEEDSSLSARVLQVANSPFFGAGRQIEALDQAVAMLGSRLIRSLSMVHGVFQSIDDAVLPLGFDPRAEQAHATATAALARKLAGPARGDGAFSAGLLHDLGRLLLAIRAPDQFDRVIDHARANGTSMLAAERATLGTDHAEIGGFLLGAWGLPTQIISAVRHHHQPAGESDRRGFAIYVHLANSLIREAAPESDLFPPTFDEATFAVVGHGGDLADWREMTAAAVGT